MKRIAFVSLLVLFSAGCRGGLLSRLFRGDSCNGTCGLSLPAPADTGCNNCGTGTVTSGYPSYEGEVYSGNVYSSGIVDGTVVDPYYNGSVVDGTIVGSSTVTPMAPINP